MVNVSTALTGAPSVKVDLRGPLGSVEVLGFQWEPDAAVRIVSGATQENTGAAEEASLLGSGTGAVFDAMADLFAGWPARLDARDYGNVAPGSSARPAEHVEIQIPDDP